MHSHQ